MVARFIELAPQELPKPLPTTARLTAHSSASRESTQAPEVGHNPRPVSLAPDGGAVDPDTSTKLERVKLLVITSEPITADHLRAAIGPAATDDAEVLVIAPALHNSALRFWLSDADEAIAQAEVVQAQSVDELDAEGITASGETGESEPMTAIADALETFPADRIALFIHSESEQAYRESITAAEIEERFGLPVTVREIER